MPIVRRVEAACFAVGFDLVHAFGVATYNLTAPPSAKLFDFGRGNPLGLLIGNTRDLWPHFTRAWASDEALTHEQHPLDTYVTTRLEALLPHATSSSTEVTFAHTVANGPFPIQRLAEQVGFAAVSPCHLAIHPTHGPWFALRAVVVVDVAGPEQPSPEVQRPCNGCSEPCVPALEHARAVSGEPLSAAAVAEHEAEWIAVRDACPVGRASRYGQMQLHYHYCPSRVRLPRAR